MGKIRIGIIGTGGIAIQHIQAYLRRDDVEIVALCDIVPGKAKAFGERYNVPDAKIYLSHEEMLDKEKLDAVSVCTYNRQHAAPTICALEHGVHVVLEKPFSVTLDEAVAMCKAEKASGKILTIGFQPRFDKNMQQIKHIIDSGELGKIYYIQTGGGRRRGIPAHDDVLSFIREDQGGVGALGDIGCYALDMVLNAIGYPKPLTVSGFTTDYFGKDPETYKFTCSDPKLVADSFGVDDFAGGLIRLEGGIILDFRISWAMNIDTPGDTIILGTKGGLRIPSTGCWNGSVGGPMVIYKTIAGQDMQSEVPIINEKYTGSYWDMLWDRKIGSFIKAIREGGTAPIPTSQILYNQAILSGILESAKIGREIEIEIPEI